MLDTHGIIDLQKLRTTLVKKTSRRIQSSCSPFTPQKTPKALKKLGGMQTTKGAREKFVKIMVFVAQGIKNPFLLLEPIPLIFH